VRLIARGEEWRVNNFDLIRLAAAVQVMLVHANQVVHNSGRVAHLFDALLRLFPGVPIFFVVSGFLISRSYENSLNAGDYFRNRCLRIFPALWVCLVVSVGVILCRGVGTLAPISARDWLLWWAGQMSVFQGFPAPFMLPPGTRFNGSLWTIPIELEFYLLLPSLYALFGPSTRRANLLLAGSLCASLALHFAVLEHRPWLLPPKYDFLLDTIFPYLWIFLVGVLMQRNWDRLRRFLVGRMPWWLLGYLFVCAISVWLRRGVGSANIGPVYLLPLAGLVISSAMTARTLSDRLLHGQDLSYGVYIYHMLVVYLMVPQAVLPPALAVAVLTLITLALATLSWHLVEQPFLIRKHRSIREPQTPRPLASPTMIGLPQ
jgi:peptidoglycan/LPS O-acetylase OafA/YrhL